MDILGLNSLSRFLIGTDRFTRTLPVNGDNNIPSIFGGARIVYETIDNREFELFNTTPEIYIPVIKKANMFSNGIFRVHDYKTNEIIESHELLKLLESPNPLQNRNEFLKAISINYDIYGNSYTYKNVASGLAKYPTTLTTLRNDDIAIDVIKRSYTATEIDEIIKNYALKSNPALKFEPSEIVHIKNFSIDGVRGISMLHALNMPLSNGRASYGFLNANQSKKGGLGIISPTGSDAIGALSLEEEDKKELTKQYLNDNGIFEGQNAVKISNKPINYQNTNYPIDTQLIMESIDLSMKKVIDAIGLNQNIFSQDKQSTFNNLNTGLKMAYQDCIIPFGEQVCYALNDAMDLFSKGIYISLDYSHVPCMQENESEKAMEYKMKAEAVGKLVEIGYSLQDAETLLGIKQP